MNKRTRYFSILFFGNEERRVCRNKPVTLSAIATPNLERCLVRSLEGYCHFRERVTRTVLTPFSSLRRADQSSTCPRKKKESRRKYSEKCIDPLSTIYLYFITEKHKLQLLFASRVHQLNSPRLKVHNMP